MNDERNALQAKFVESGRFANFGNVLMSMHAKGFRCHYDTFLEISSPITALCGLNGTGKSTLLQLAAAAYDSPRPNIMPTFHISDFLVVGTLDPAPFASNATIEYKYCKNDSSTRRVTLSRTDTPRRKRWRGYQQRPKRSVFFAGISLYLPKIEKPDFIYRNANRLTVSNTNEVSERIKSWTCDVLGQSYENILSNEVTYSKRKGNVISVHRSGTNYSEAHMGYGEGRTLYLISMLEKIPEKSLVLIEEPETSLHPSAQFQFGRYLVNVSKERGHQIFLTTHSEFILNSLHSKSRIFINRTDGGIRPIVGLTALQAKSLMSNGSEKALHILVEDKCAKSILFQIIKKVDINLLQSVGIYPAGDSDVIAKTVRSLKDTGLPVVAIRDGDKGDSIKEGIFKLPGSLPPEKELFSNREVKDYILSQYNINLDDFLATLRGVDHHDWLERLAKQVSHDEIALVSEMAQIYAGSLPEGIAMALIKPLIEASRR
jgi:predicted ATPase